ncbi:MAG: ABC transporter substrate-binding protein [Terriglobia bacterium]
MSLRHLMMLFLLAVCSCREWSCREPAPAERNVTLPSGRTGGSLRLAAQSPSSLDPIQSRSYWESGIVLQLFDGLVRFDSVLNIVPSIAQDWSISPDGRIYRFELRKGVRFHNGREVEAEDFVYSFSRLLDPKAGSPDSYPYWKILGASQPVPQDASGASGLRALGRYQLEIRLEHPYAPFLRLLAMQPASVVPREALTSGNPFSIHPIGTGPFRLAAWDPSSGIRLIANTDYFEGRPWLDELYIRTYPALSASQSFRDFLDGKLDLSFIPSERIKEVKNHSSWSFVNRPVLRFLYLGLNMKDPLLRDPAIRKAICHAINKTEVINNAFDYEVTHSILPNSLLGSDFSNATDPYDPGTARQCLEQYRANHGKNVTLQLWHASVSDSRSRLLSKISADLETIGFRVELKLVSSMETLLSAIYSGQAQLFLLGEQIDFPDPDALLDRLFNSRSPGNPFGYRNPEVDRWLMEAQMTLDDGQRAKQYGAIEQQILSDHVILPLAFIRYSYVYAPRFRNLEVNVLGFQCFPSGKSGRKASDLAIHWLT